ncbi:MAG TPA: hypothetical protein VMX14_00860 [Anaerolineae bacterium]|nr:hypothetical protein [Anaerolineae bacterium]
MVFRTGSVHQRPRQLTQVVVALSLLLVLAMAARAENGAVHLLYFYDPNCPDCEKVHGEVLEPLLAECGDRVVIEERSIAETDNFDLLLDLEQQYQVVGGSIPEVFIGEDVLIGPNEIRDSLTDRIEFYLSQGGVALPPLSTPGVTLSATSSADCDDCADTHTAQRTAVAARRTPSSNVSEVQSRESASLPIHVAFFSQPGCDECERSEHDLKYIQEEYPQVQVTRLDVREEAALNQYLCERAGVAEHEHLTAPALFVGKESLVGEQVRARAIEALLEPYLETGASEPWAGWEAEREVVQKTIVERFRSLGLLTVVAAGLLDGVNPCAFATMIFLISYLTFHKREGKQLLATGGAFTAGVFLTYLGVGFGFLKFLSSLPFLDVIGKWVYGITAVLCLGLAWGSFADYRKAKEGRLEDMSLKLPGRMREWTKTLIREGTGARRFVLSAFMLGFGVSVVELACTGQVYLPTIIFVLGIPEWRAQASIALLVYNLMFILPLIVIFLTVYYGTTSQQLIDWLTRRSATVKLGMGVLFLLLAAWLIYSIVAL